MLDRREVLALMMAAAAGTVLPEGSEQQGKKKADDDDIDATVSKERKADAKVYSSAEKGAIAPVFAWLRFGDVKPAGWIKQQMLQDLHSGFAGHLDKLCMQVGSDSFGKNRAGIEARDDNKSWWNAEAEGNWRQGYIGLAFLSGDEEAQRASREYIEHILSTQEPDGYIGAYKPEVRYTISGELWVQAGLFRAMLDYAELTGDARVRQAVLRACDRIVAAYGEGKHPLTMLNGHDLMISDVMERLHAMTDERRYLDFALWLYQMWGNDFHTSKFNSSTEICLPALLDVDTGFTQHGVHVLEGMRIPLWLWMATGREDMGQASRNSFGKLARYTEPTGVVVSEETIHDLKPDPTATEYEYCAIREMQNTLESLLQKTGSAPAADAIERIWFNAAQGARLADGTGLTYLTPDNRLQCNGTTVDGEKKQPRNKFSPTHQDVAVCCNPSATNVSQLYVRGMWMRHTQSDGLAALLYGPCSVNTVVRGVRVAIEQATHYPFSSTVSIAVHPEKHVEFPILLRDPEWSRGTKVSCAAATITRTGNYWTVTKAWKPGDQIVLTFAPEVREINAVNGEVALAYGPLLFAQEIPSEKTVVKRYELAPFEDAYYSSTAQKEKLELPSQLRWRGYGFEPVAVETGDSTGLAFSHPSLCLEGKMKRASDRSEVQVRLVPIGCAPVLRRLTFPVSL